MVLLCIFYQDMDKWYMSFSFEKTLFKNDKWNFADRKAIIFIINMLRYCFIIFWYCMYSQAIRNHNGLKQWWDQIRLCNWRTAGEPDKAILWSLDSFKWNSFVKRWLQVRISMVDHPKCLTTEFLVTIFNQSSKVSFRLDYFRMWPCESLSQLHMGRKFELSNWVG